MRCCPIRHTRFTTISTDEDDPSLGIDKTIADARLADDVTLSASRVFFQLFAYLVDEHANVVIFAFLVIAPDFVEQRSMRDDLAGVC